MSNYKEITNKRKPIWLKSKLPPAEVYSKIKNTLDAGCLNTICESGKCPNIGECWTLGTATFMILGNSCTRNCKFCAVSHTKPEPINEEEPIKLAETVLKFKLKHCIITSVTRDDLEDEGANHWAMCIEAVRKLNPKTTIEVLTPDFHAKSKLLKIVAKASPDIFSHNIETVKSLTPKIRSEAQYNRSLEVLKITKSLRLKVKSGIMVGLGESVEDVFETIRDLRNAGCEILTVGQYLRPREENYPVVKYYFPEEFEDFKKFALSLGFSHVESAPLVRSSYHSEKALL